jgi:hypothetical protein
MAWMRTKVNIATGIKPKDRVALSEAIINYIQNRTLDGLDKNLEPFIKYTAGYAKFKGVGVNDVDLTFSGDMLLDMKLLSHKNGELTIGFEKGSQSNGKAEGNIKGTYGQSSPVNKGRDFLGISDEEVAALIDNVDIDETSFSGLSDAEIDKLARDAAREILGDIDFN